MAWTLLGKIADHFLSFDFFVTFLTWISIFVGAAITFVVRTDHGLPRTFRGYLRFCFPREIVTTRTCRADAIFYVVNRLSTPLIITPLLLGSAACATTCYHLLTIGFGAQPQEPQSLLVLGCVAAAAVIVADFATFYTHYLDHKIPFLWEFHKVHHSAEFLVPITNKRFHPVQQVFDNGGVALATGALLGIAAYVLRMPLYENTIVGLDAYFVINAFSFYHLRHSHIPMSYGWLERWLLSPAQHQLHHSRETRHWDRNFGLFLSVWDRLFGTMLLAEPPGSYRLGLPGNEGARFGTVRQLYITPIANVWAIVWGSLRRTGGARTGGARADAAGAEPARQARVS